MRETGHNETGKNAPRSQQQIDHEIKENTKSFLYALDSIPDEYLNEVLRIAGFVGESTGRVWSGKVDL